MGIQNTTRKASVVPNGSVGPHSFPFRIQKPEDLRCFRVDPTTLAITEIFRGGTSLNWSLQFSPDLRSSEGGKVTLGADLAATFTAGLQLLMLRDVDNQQNTRIPVASPFPEGSVEAALDRLTMRDIEIEEGLARSVTFPVSAPVGFSGTVDKLVPRRAVVVNAAGTGLTLTDFDPDNANNVAADRQATEAARDAALQAKTDTQTALNNAQTDFLSFLIPAPVAYDYPLVLNIPYPGNILNTTVRTDAGTVDAVFKINGTAINGAANTATVAKSTVTRTAVAANKFVAGNDLTMTLSNLSANTAPTGLAVTVQIKRTAT